MRTWALWLVPLAAWIGCNGEKEPPIDTEDDNDDTAVDTFVEDSDSDVVIDTNPPPPEFDCSAPAEPGLQHVCNYSVNRAAVIAPTAAGDPLVLRTDQSGANPVGGYNGFGLGNRAMAGLHSYSLKKLDTFELVAFDARIVTNDGLTGPEVGLVVDLECDFGPYAYLMVAYDDLPPPDDVDGLDRYAVYANQERWTSPGGLYDPSGETLLLPDPELPMERGPGPLSNVTGAWPAACIRNVKSQLPNMPKDTLTSGLMLALGKPSTLSKNEVQIHRIQVGIGGESFVWLPIE